jgi:hypothetical protein
LDQQTSGLELRRLIQNVCRRRDEAEVNEAPGGRRLDEAHILDNAQHVYPSHRVSRLLSGVAPTAASSNDSLLALEPRQSATNRVAGYSMFAHERRLARKRAAGLERAIRERLRKQRIQLMVSFDG